MLPASKPRAEEGVIVLSAFDIQALLENEAWVREKKNVSARDRGWAAATASVRNRDGPQAGPAAQEEVDPVAVDGSVFAGSFLTVSTVSKKGYIIGNFMRKKFSPKRANLSSHSKKVLV